MSSLWAALLTLLVAAAPAGEPEWKRVLRQQAELHTFDPLKREFSAATVAALQRLSSTREHLGFVKAHGIDLRVVAPGDKMPEGAIGSYVHDDRSMYINEDELMSGVRELRDQGAPEERIPEIIAWKFLPVTVHEIRHAITRQRLKRKTGLDLRLNPIEGEYLSFLDEARVLKEALKARPELWGDPSRILEVERSQAHVMEKLNRDVKELKELVDLLYRGKPSILGTPRVELIARYRGLRAELERHADELLATDVASIKDADLRADLGETALEVADGLLLYRQMLSALESDGSYEKLRRFYESELAALTRALEPGRKE